jgi:hypothetical protein
MHEYESDPEINLASISLSSLKTPYIHGLSLNNLVNIALESDYRGLQWQPPVRLSIANLQLKWRLDNISPEILDKIRSGQESWRSEKSLAEAWTHETNRFGALLSQALPYKLDSLTQLGKIQQAINKSGDPRELPVTIWELEEDVDAAIEAGLHQRLIEPHPKLVDVWGLKDWWLADGRTDEEKVSKIIDKALNRGYTAFDFDPFHWQLEHEGITMPALKDAVPQLLPHIAQVGISAGRIDMLNQAKEAGIDTMAWLDDLLNGTTESKLQTILSNLKKEGYKGPAVVKIPIGAIAQQTQNRLLMLPDEINAAHTSIKNNVEKLLY